MKKTYTVMSIDKNDGLTDVGTRLGSFDSLDAAIEFVKSDMREYRDNYTFVDDVTGATIGPSEYDEHDMVIANFDGSASCSWSIVESEIPAN